MTTVAALKKLYVALGGNTEDVKNLSLIPEVIDAMAFLENGGVTVAAMAAATELWGYTISQLQTEVAVSGKAISGTLNKITEGSLADVWGAGYFIALTFAPNAEAVKTEVAILPTQGAGWQELDSDMACVFKVTDKATQKINVRAYDANGNTITEEYTLSDLVLDDR